MGISALKKTIPAVTFQTLGVNKCWAAKGYTGMNRQVQTYAQNDPLSRPKGCPQALLCATIILTRYDSRDNRAL